jgi:hypothetical protein
MRIFNSIQFSGLPVTDLCVLNLMIRVLNIMLQKKKKLLGCLTVGTNGSVPERLMGADCKSAGYAYAGSNPARPTTI